MGSLPSSATSSRAPEVSHDGGRRLFDELPERVELEQTDVSTDDGVTHLSYRVVR